MKTITTNSFNNTSGAGVMNDVACDVTMNCYDVVTIVPPDDVTMVTPDDVTMVPPDDVTLLTDLFD